MHAEQDSSIYYTQAIKHLVPQIQKQKTSQN